ncbi:MAG: RNA polymerase sigma factor [Solirubrobacteraceae bacterium]
MTTPPDPRDRTARAVAAVWRIESARVGAVARMVHDLALAEDLAQDAVVAALEQWPRSGIPDNPGAWLTVAAKRRAIDELRRREMAQRRHELLGREAAHAAAPDPASVAAAALDDAIGDDQLSLLFATCHPLLAPAARAALTLRLFGGLTTAEIAHAFLVAEPTISQRIVRAKRTLSAANVPVEVPTGEELPERLDSVLEVIYLIFNEGYAATGGGAWMRPALCEDALRLGRIIAGLLPDRSEVHGLVALMELQASRMRARLGPTGEPLLLAEQDRSHWDRTLIRRGLAALRRAERLGSLGPYALQAAIAACHARASSPEETDWQRIVALYDALAQATPSPVIELNRAVAVSMAYGPQAALELVDSLLAEPALSSYHLLPSVRGDLLARLGRDSEARSELERAASLTANAHERLLLERRAERLKRRPRRSR